jgi:hypothetical protein
MSLTLNLALVVASRAEAFALMDHIESRGFKINDFSAYTPGDNGAVAAVPEAPAPAPAPEKPKASAKPVPTPPAAAPAPAATQPTAATAPTAAPSKGDAVDYATLSKAVLDLMKLDQAAPGAIAQSLGFQTFKLMKEAENAQELFAKALPLVKAKTAELLAV